MVQPVSQHGSARSQEDPFIITRTQDGFRIYSPFEPGVSHLVTGVPGEPRCTCPEFLVNEAASQEPCPHIQAVWTRFGTVRPAEVEDPSGAEERRAIQAEGRSAPANGAPAPPDHGETRMLLKRSVSPDGRIDSLSVEFSCPLNGEPESEVKSRALRLLGLQAEIAASFLNGRGGASQNGKGSPPRNSAPSAAPARITGIGASQGKWGRRLFITFETEGKTLRLYGSKKQLEEKFIEAGYPQFRNLIQEGVRFDLPCRVVTERSQDGKFLNVAQVLPAAGEARDANGHVA